MAAGFPAPVLVTIPSDGIIPVTGSLLNSTFDVIPPDLREGTLHSWNVAFQRAAAVPASPPTSPTSATAASIS